MSNAALALEGDRARPRPIPPVAPARERRIGVGLARPRRADGARRRPEDRRPARARPPRAPSARPPPPRGSATRAACAPTPSPATRATSTSPTSSSRAARSARRSAPASSTTRAAIEACAQICEGLAHAHAAGILHRDVKPSNVLLADGDRVSVRLLDFGLARMAEAETLTAQGDVPGTLAYIAPERLAGEDATEAVRRLGRRRDALGVARRAGIRSGRRSMLDTARAIEQGARVARDAAARPAEGADPARRPRALAQPGAPAVGRRARRTRCAAPRRRARKPRARSVQPRACPAQAARAGAAALAGALRRLDARPRCRSIPHGWAVGLARRSRPRSRRSGRGSASRVALAVPVLPLGNVSLGLARRSTRRSRPRWLVLSWREPRGALLFALGPLLAPLAALGLVPLAASGAARRRRAAPRRPALAVLAAARRRRASAARRCRSPARAPPLGLGVAGVDATRSTSPARSRAPPPPIRRSSSRPRSSPRVAARAARTRRPAAAGARPASARRCSSLTVLAVPVGAGAARSSPPPG